VPNNNAGSDLASHFMPKNDVRREFTQFIAFFGQIMVLDRI
jgi:hypothetical protein